MKWGATALGVLVGACSYDSLTASETDVVLTVQSPTADYGKYKTFAITDHIVDLCGTIDPDVGLDPLPSGGAGGQGGRSGFDFNSSCYDVSHTYDQQILDGIVSQMKAYGYTQVKTRADNPDVVLLVGTVAQDNWQYQPAYPWCDPYYYYWCWYPSTGYAYNLPTAAVLINMVDVKASTTDDLKSVWFVAMQGLYATSSDATTQQRIDTSLTNAFQQSPYLDLSK
jgi:hypothetical protein